ARASRTRRPRFSPPLCCCGIRSATKRARSKSKAPWNAYLRRALERANWPAPARRGWTPRPLPAACYRCCPDLRKPGLTRADDPMPKPHPREPHVVRDVIRRQNGIEVDECGKARKQKDADARARDAFLFGSAFA